MPKRPNSHSAVEIVDATDIVDERVEIAAPPVVVRPCTLNDLRIAISALFMWWGTWSLADRLLLKYSPVPELVSIAIALLLSLIPQLMPLARARVVSFKENVNAHLQQI